LFVDGFEDWVEEIMKVSVGHKGWVLAWRGVRTVVGEPCNPFGLRWVLYASVEVLDDVLKECSLV
jgi:hypothetical protein